MSSPAPASDGFHKPVTRRDAIAPSIHFAFQPIVRLATGQVYGFEALLRGYREAGFASIDAFLSAYVGARSDCELTLLTTAAGNYLERVREQPPILFLNMSGALFDDPAFDANAVRSALAGMGIPPQKICLELSEKHKVADLALVGPRLAALRDLGFRIALDDFGQGFSELRLLQAVAPDVVKIDRCFIEGIEKSSSKRLFVATVVNLAHALGATVVAEGVETLAELHECREIGCDLVQGYYLAYPTTDPASLPKLFPVGAIGATRSRSKRGATVDAICAELQAIPPIAARDSMTAVFERFRSSPEETFLPVVDNEGIPLGIVRERDLRTYTYSVFGMDLLANRSSGKRLRNFVIPCPVVDLETPVQSMMDRLTASPSGADGLILTRDGAYAGVISAVALLKIANDQRMLAAIDQNPLSRLPGNTSIEGFLETVGGETDSVRTYCYFDFNNFKPFNDTYGFGQGDRAIKLFSDILHRHLDPAGAFLGHIGGDDFFAGFIGGSPEAIEAMAGAVLADFGAEVRNLYDPEDRLFGVITAADRAGVIQTYPLMSCAVAILVIPGGTPAPAPEVLSRWMAKAKRAAKQSPDKMARVEFSPD